MSKKDKNAPLEEESAVDKRDVDLLVDETNFAEQNKEMEVNQAAEAEPEKPSKKEKKAKKEKKKKSKEDEGEDCGKKKPPFVERARGCCGCFTGMAVTFLFVIVIVFFGGYIGANFFLKSQFGITLADCFAAINGVYTVNEDKVITEKATSEDKDAFYGEVADGVFLKSDSVSDVVDTVVDETLIPMLNKSLGGQEQPPVLASSDAPDAGFSWEEYIKQLCEDGIVDGAKVKAFMESEGSLEENYADQFVLSIKGKGIVSLVDHILDSVLTELGYQEFSGLFGVKQIRFGANDDDSVKSLDITLQVKARELYDKFFSSDLSDKLLKGSLAGNKRLMGSFGFILPQNIIAGVKLVIGESASAEIYLNNMDWKFISKWLDIVSSMTGSDIKGQLNTEIDKVYSSVKSAVAEFVDLTAMIGNGELKLDLYDVIANVLNKAIGLEGENKLDKYETASTVSNVMFANMDVNGNGRNQILTDVKATTSDFLNPDWVSAAANQLLEWLRINVAFAEGKDLEDALDAFRSQTEGASLARFLDFLDVNYLKQGLGFMKTELRIDEMLIAYLFEGFKEQLVSSFAPSPEGGEESVALKAVKQISLEYIKLAQNDKDGVRHTYLTLGISAPVEGLLSAIGQEKFAFVSAVLGDELFICANVDVTAPTSGLVRESTTFRINGLSQAQTMQIVNTVTKIIKKDVVAEFVDKYVNEFVDKINSYGFGISFAVSEQDGGSKGTIVLPSTASLLQAIVKETTGKEIDGESFISALDAIITSTYIPNTYTAFVSETCASLYGDADKYADLDEKDAFSKIVINQIYTNYLLKDDELAEGYLSPDRLVDKLTEIMTDPDSAIDVITGNGEDPTFVAITRAYFAARPDLDSTKPKVDGHTLAYILDESRSAMVDLFGSEDSELLDLVSVDDIVFTGDSATSKGRMVLTVSVNTNDLIEEFADTLGEYKTFVKNLLGGVGKKITLELSINLDEEGKRVSVRLNDLTSENMDALFDTLVTFGLNIFDFNDSENELVKLGHTLKYYLNTYATIKNGTIELPSLFTIANKKVIAKDNITDEKLFLALHDYVLSNVSYESYADEGKIDETNTVLAKANLAVGVTVEAQPTYAAVARVQIEEKFMLKDDKNVGDVIDVLSLPKSQRANAMLGDGGIVKSSRADTKKYFGGVSENGVTYDEYEKTKPILDGHTLAYVMDTYKDDIKNVVRFADESANALFDEITIGDISVDDDLYMTLIIRFDVEKIFEAIGGDEADLGKQIFGLFVDSENKKMSVKLTKSLVKESSEKAKVVINDMTDDQLSNLSEIMEVFGIDHFNLKKEDNIFEKMAVELKKMINEYMPFDQETKCFTISSLFAYAGENIEIAGEDGEEDRIQTLSGEETYDLIKTLTMHEANSVLDVDGAKTAFDKQTAQYYYLKDGTDTVKNVISEGETESSLTFVNEVDGHGNEIKSSREIIVEENTEEIVGGVDMHGNPTKKRKTKDVRVYTQGFTVSEEHLAGLVNNLGLVAKDSDYTVDSIRVTANGQIRVYVILERAKFVNEDKIGALKDFDVLPEMFHVWIPLNFSSDESVDLVSWGLASDDVGEESTDILRYTLAKLGISLDSTVNEYKSDISDSMKNKLDKYSMSFVPDVVATADNEAGLSMPSMAKLLSITRNDSLASEGKTEDEFVSEEETVFMLDNFVCYTTDDYDFDEDEKILARTQFMDLMNRYYMIDDDKANAYNDPTNASNAYWNTLYALNLKNANSEAGETDVALVDIIDWSQLGTVADIVSGNYFNSNVDTSKIFNVAISTVLFNDVADFGEFDLEQVYVEKDGWVTIEGEIYLYHAEESSEEESLGELAGNICPNMKALMPEVVTVMISLNLNGEEFNYEIVDMPNPDGDISYDGMLETKEQANTDKLMDVFDKFGASMDREDFAKHANKARDSINKIFARLEGSTVVCVDETVVESLTPEQRIPATTDHDHDHGCEFDGMSGIFVPSLKSYLFRNWGIVMQAKENNYITEY